jgi:hypothetical protein
VNNARQSGNVKVVQVTWGLRYSRRTLTEVWRVIAWRGGFELFQPGTVERNAMRVSAKALL